MSSAGRGVGIDIGATAVRVVEVDGLDADSVAQITKCAIVPLRSGAVSGGQINDVNAVAMAVSKAVKEARVKTYGAVLGVSGAESVVETVVLAAALKPAEWPLALRTMGNELSPRVPLSNAALSMYPVLSAADRANPNQRTLLAGAVLDSEVDKVLAVAKLAKITPRAVDLSAAAMARALTRAVVGNDDVATLVDVGSSKVTVATRQGLHLRSVRTFEGGGERITRAIMGARGGSYDDAEEAKLSMRLPSEHAGAPLRLATAPSVQALYGELQQASSTLVPGEEAAQDALGSATANLIDDIAGAIEADASEHPNRPTGGILMCGGTSLLRGFRDQLIQRVGVTAVVARPWARVVPSKRTEAALVGDGEDPTVLLSLATAVGLATWKDPR